MSKGRVLKPAMGAAAQERLHAFAARMGPGPAVLTGTVWAEAGKAYNAVVLLDEGRVAAVRYKVALPNHGVVADNRVFAALS